MTFGEVGVQKRREVNRCRRRRRVRSCTKFLVYRPRPPWRRFIYEVRSISSHTRANVLPPPHPLHCVCARLYIIHNILHIVFADICVLRASIVPVRHRHSSVVLRSASVGRRRRARDRFHVIYFAIGGVGNDGKDNGRRKGRGDDDGA